MHESVPFLQALQAVAMFTKRTALLIATIIFILSCTSIATETGEPLDVISHFITEISATITLPKEYNLVKKSELNRRGSFAAYDFTPYGGKHPRFAEIQFFSEASIEAFNEKCSQVFCFEGDYPTLERYFGQKEAFSRLEDFKEYKLKQFINGYFFVISHSCEVDNCVIRKYTTFLGDMKVDVWIVLEHESQRNEGDQLFSSFDIQV